MMSNDGITDVNECGGVNLTISESALDFILDNSLRGTNSNNIVNTGAFTPIQAIEEPSNILRLNWRFDSASNGDSFSIMQTFGEAVSGLTFTASDTGLRNSYVIIWTITRTGTTGTLMTSIASNPDNYANKFLETDYSKACSVCDTNQNGTPNSLDTDSDNDYVLNGIGFDANSGNTSMSTINNLLGTLSGNVYRVEVTLINNSCLEDETITLTVIPESIAIVNNAEVCMNTTSSVLTVITTSDTPINYDAVAEVDFTSSPYSISCDVEGLKGNVSNTTTIIITVNPILNANRDMVIMDFDSTIDIISNPSSGKAIIDNGNTSGNPDDDIVTYTPDSGFNDTDTFVYEGYDDSISPSCTVAMLPLSSIHRILMYLI